MHFKFASLSLNAVPCMLATHGDELPTLAVLRLKLRDGEAPNPHSNVIRGTSTLGQLQSELS